MRSVSTCLTGSQLVPIFRSASMISTPGVVERLTSKSFWKCCIESSHRLRWSSTAEQDLREAWRYYVSVASADVADKMLNRLKDASRKAAEQPLLRRPRDDIAPGTRSVLVHPYAVFYRVADDAVEVMRVLHQRRDLAELLGRHG